MSSHANKTKYFHVKDKFHVIKMKIFHASGAASLSSSPHAENVNAQCDSIFKEHK